MAANSIRVCWRCTASPVRGGPELHTGRAADRSHTSRSPGRVAGLALRALPRWGQGASMRSQSTAPARSPGTPTAGRPGGASRAAATDWPSPLATTNRVRPDIGRSSVILPRRSELGSGAPGTVPRRPPSDYRTPRSAKHRQGHRGMYATIHRACRLRCSRTSWYPVGLLGTRSSCRIWVGVS